MKHELLDTTRVVAVGATGSYSTWALQDVNLIVAILVGLATGAFVSLKIAKLLYNWYWEHKARMGQLKTQERTDSDAK